MLWRILAKRQNSLYRDHNRWTRASQWDCRRQESEHQILSLLVPMWSVFTTISCCNSNVLFSIHWAKVAMKQIWSEAIDRVNSTITDPERFSPRHIVYAPSKNNQYAADGFPSISDAIADGNSTEIFYAVAIATYFVRGALATLKEFENFFPWRLTFLWFFFCGNKSQGNERMIDFFLSPADGST